MSEPDMLSVDGAKYFTETALSAARLVFERDGKILRPLGMFIARKNPRTRVSYAQPRVIPWGVTTNEFDTMERDALSGWLKTMIRKSKAAAFCFTTEAWVLVGEDDPNARAWAGRVSEHPNRRETVFTSVEHIAIPPATYQAEIVRDHVGRPTLCSWEKWEPSDTEGRFGYMLPTEGDTVYAA